VPTFLTAIFDPVDEAEAVALASGVRGCAYCGGLGHRIAECPKLKTENREQEARRKDWFGAAGGIGAEY